MLAPERLYLIVGDDEYLCSNAVKEAIAQQRRRYPAAEVREVEIQELAAAQLPELLSPSLFEENRILVFHNCHNAGKDLIAGMTQSLQSLPDDVAMIIAHNGTQRAKPLLDVLREAGAKVTSAAKLTRHRDRISFVRTAVARVEGTITDDAAEALLLVVGADLREVASACEQLVRDLEGRIDLEGVSRYYRGRAEVTGFAVADAVMVGHAAQALELLRWALLAGTDPVPIADALADGVRTVARVVSAGSANPGYLAKELGMPPWKIERARRQSHGWSATGLATAMRSAARLNAEVKGGGDDREHSLQAAVLSMVKAREIR